MRLADDGDFVAGEYKGLSGGDGSRGWIRYNGPQCLAPDVRDCAAVLFRDAHCLRTL